LGAQGTGLLRCMTHSNGGFCKGTGGGPGANGATGAGAGVTGGVAVWLEGAGDWLVWVITFCWSAGDEVGGIELESLSMPCGNGGEVAT
jgi:hypothetical protein